MGTGNQDQALAELAGDWPRWHFWRGVGGLWYARRLRRSPPAVLRDAEAQGLVAKVRAWEDGRVTAGTQPARDVHRILVTGSREWDDPQAIFDVLAEYNYGQVTLVHGAARGTDTIAARIAAAFGWRIEVHPADWRNLGKSAGFIRNAAMVAAGADVCLAFIRDGSPGASHCAHLAEQAGIPVRRFTR